MDRAFPVVLYKEKIPVEFITYPSADIKMIQKIIGEQIAIDKIDKFDFLLRHRISIKIQAKKKNKEYLVYCAKPSAFLCHKGATFLDRESKEKQAKDLYYMYFVLRYSPDINLTLGEISQYREEGCLKNVSDNIDQFFESVSSRGCLWVERENGPDEYVHDLRQDIFDRFKRLSEAIKRMDV